MIGLRMSRRGGRARIAYYLGMHPTVHKILTRYRCLRLSWTDPATGAPVRAQRRKVRRDEHAAPGDLVSTCTTRSAPHAPPRTSSTR